MDSKGIERARRMAEARQPQPKRGPGEAAALAFVVSWVVIGTYSVVDEWASRSLAGILTAALAAMVAFADYRQKWRLHTEAFRDALNFVDRDDNS